MTMKTFRVLPWLFFGVGVLNAQTPVESDFYSITPFNTPAETALEVSSVELLPGRKVAVGTRRGEIWMVDGAYDADVSKAQFKRFAEGQHEVMGLAWKDGFLYATNRYEVLRM
jgi:glucose/arabinose dehydrogenase